MRWIVAIALFGFSITANAQGKKFMSKFDTLLTLNSYAGDASVNIDEEIDADHIDKDLLSTAVIIVLNERRAKKKRSTLAYNASLDLIARNYTELSSRSKFKSVFNKKFRSKAHLKKAARLVDYRSGILKTVVGSPKLVDYQGSNFWCNRKSPEGGFKLFKGRKPDMRDTTYVAIPIENHTYRSFAETMLDRSVGGSGRQKLMDKAYDYVACDVKVVESSIHKSSKLPYASAIIIVGGRRLKFVAEKYP